MHINIEDIIKEGYLISAKSEFTKAGIEEALKFAYEKGISDGKEIVKEIYHFDYDTKYSIFKTDEFEYIIDCSESLLELNDRIEDYYKKESHYYINFDEIVELVSYKRGIITNIWRGIDIIYIDVLFNNYQTGKYQINDGRIYKYMKYNGKHYESIKEFIDTIEENTNED